MRFLRGLLYVVLGLVVLAVLLAGGIWFASDRALAARITPPAATFDATGGDVARGRHFVASTLDCTGCHRAHLDGATLINDPMLATIAATNLTRGAGGIGATFTDTDFERAIRHGLRPDGTRLVVMPSEAFSALSDADLRDVIAYVRSFPPVDRSTPARSLGPIGRLGLVLGKFTFEADHIDQAAPHAAAQPPAADAVYGRYLAHIGSCYDCHSANLAGGKSIGGIPAANITPAAIGTWSLGQFETTLRKGVDPSGRHLRAMPWRAIGKMSDLELTALYTFLKTVPRVTTPNT
jgi:mono/diheme cytochrome c family protein